MKTNIQFFILCSLMMGGALGLIGCQSGGSGSLSASPGTPPQPKPITATSSRACFDDDSLCFETVNASQLVDPADYVYADPATFPTPSEREQYIAPSRFIDLSVVNESAAIAENFIVKDFMDVSHGRYALISPEIVSVMQQIRDALNEPVYITSGYRSPAHNSTTDGSALWSRHMYGDGIDFSSANPNYTQLQTLCKQFDASFTLIYSTHIHCDWRLHNLDPAFYNTGATVPQVFGEIEPDAKMIFTQTGNTVNVGVQMTDEDADDANEGSPIYQWQIQDAQGHATSSSASTLELPIAGAPYTIDVLVGGSIHLEQTWPQ